MPVDIDKDLLQRLQALRGSSATPEKPTAPRISIDVIQRAQTPTREDTLAARLKSLRSQDEASSPSSKPKDSPQPAKSPFPHVSSIEPSSSYVDPTPDEDIEAMFQTDDTTLEELLADVDSDGQEEGSAEEPGDDKVKALLEELSKAVPQDLETENNKNEIDSDDSDGEHMTHEVDDVIARFRDEAELDVVLGKEEPKSPPPEHDDDDQDDEGQENEPPDLALPSVPSNLGGQPTSPSARAATADLDDITTRMAALRAGGPEDDDEALAFPSVPASRPSGKPVKRLISKTNYTDEDMESWCTVCLEDATLRCLGCDNDVYCSRCWREMHVGPAAAFDDRSHKAVQFTKDKKKKEKKVALGAS